MTKKTSPLTPRRNQPKSPSRSKPRTAAFGGELGLGRRKTARPFHPSQALHVVLRSDQARGMLSLLRPANAKRIKTLLRQAQIRWDIKVYRFANVGNHLHLLVKARSRSQWQGFIRQFSGSVAQQVTGAVRGRGFVEQRRRGERGALMAPRGGRRTAIVSTCAGGPRATPRGTTMNIVTPRGAASNPATSQGATAITPPRRFWDHLVYTRMVAWGRDFNSVSRYVVTNLWEGMGIPLRRYVAQGLELLHLHEDGFVMVHERAPPEVRAAFGV